MKRYFIYFIFFYTFSSAFCIDFEDLPSAYKGRFRPVDVSADMWIQDIVPYLANHKELWRMHFLGHKPWDDQSLFKIQNTELKRFLNIDSKVSYHALEVSVYGNNLQLLKYVLPYFFLKKYSDPTNRALIRKWELTPWFPGLWIIFGKNLEIAQVPNSTLLHQLKPGSVIDADVSNLKEQKQILRKRKTVSEGLLSLLSQMRQYESMQGSTPIVENAFEKAFLELKNQDLSNKAVGSALENQFPLYLRLEQTGNDFKMLPSRTTSGLWYSLRALKCQVYDPAKNQLVPAPNFTAYSDEHFYQIRDLYFKLEQAMLQNNRILAQELTSRLSVELRSAYTSLEGKRFINTGGKALKYPTLNQLRAEGFYHRYPLVIATMIGYGITLVLYAFRWRKAGFIFLCCTFMLHTFVLALRSYVMGRPPVSNMAETVLYVPWMAVFASIFLSRIFKNDTPLIGSSLAALMLLAVQQITGLEDSMENVQAVLDSQYWLITHVLLVVGSYGLFILCGVLGHIYLIWHMRHKIETPFMRNLAGCLLQALYIGTAMLITGTLLGGVWAAESWGRFWDWDPKEAWAFISSCVYLIWIHAYRFQHITNFGLAIGSIAGLIAVSFTWYGVNYILGTGLHSYGFGSGGEVYYYLFVVIELIFIGTANYVAHKTIQTN